MKSLFKDTHKYDNEELKNILSHYRSSDIVVFPVVNDGYVLNNVIEYLEKSSEDLLPTIFLLDKNWFLLNLYNNILYFKDELISSLQFIEKTYNESFDKFSIYDLFVSFLHLKKDVYINDFYEYEDVYSLKSLSLLSLGNHPWYSTNIAFKQNIKSICAETYFGMTALVTSAIRKSRKNNYNNYDYPAANNYVKDQKRYNKTFIIEGGADVYETTYSFDVYDKHFINSISPYRYITDSAIYLAITYLTHSNNDIFDLINNWYLGKPDLNLYFNNDKLNFKDVYNTINTLYNYMKCFNFEIHIFDLKSLFIKYKHLQLSNNDNNNIFMYINCCNEFGKYDYEFSNVVVPRLIGQSPNNFLRFWMY